MAKENRTADAGDGVCFHGRIGEESECSRRFFDGQRAILDRFSRLSRRILVLGDFVQGFDKYREYAALVYERLGFPTRHLGRTER